MTPHMLGSFIGHPSDYTQDEVEVISKLVAMKKGMPLLICLESAGVSSWVVLLSGRTAQYNHLDKCPLDVPWPHTGLGPVSHRPELFAVCALSSVCLWLPITPSLMHWTFTDPSCLRMGLRRESGSWHQILKMNITSHLEAPTDRVPLAVDL